MRLPITIFLLLLLGPLLSLGQISTSLARKIVSADTVLLVTHGQTEGAVIRDETTGKYKNADTVVVGGRPNFNVITESKLISTAPRQQLVSILRRPFQDKTIETCKCFVPFHAIIVVKDGIASYIEICFACNSLKTSEKTASLDYMDKQKQKELQKLFIDVGLSVE
jgi:hypothetical protein